MKKSFLRMAKLAVITALLCAGCGDDEKSPDWNGEADGFVGRMSGTPFYTLTTNASPTNCGTVSRSSEKTSYPSGTVVTVTVSTAGGCKFAGWSETSTFDNASVTVTMNGNKTLTAYFELPVTISSIGTGATGRGDYRVGATVRISAGTAPEGQKFKNWTSSSNGVTFAKADSATTTFIMPGNAVTVTAVFEPIYYAVTIYSAGTGATKDSSYAKGTTVRISAGTPPAGQQFKEWTTTSSDVTFANANSAMTTFTMPARAVTVTAVFEPSSAPTSTYTLTTSVSPSGGGSVSRSPNQTSYSSGANVTVTATAASGYTFTGWSGAFTSTSSSITITMNGNVTVTANFQQQTGGGGGVVGGNNCTSASSCKSAVMPDGKRWMTENLNIAKSDSWCYGDGGEAYVVAEGRSRSLTEPEIQANCAKYGMLYTWAAAKSACPAGWKLPDTADWNRMVEAAGGVKVANSNYWYYAGAALKANIGWYNYSTGNPQGNGTDSLGFSALPGGSRRTNGSFYGAGSFGFWWTALENGSNAYHRSMDYNDDFVYEGNYYDKGLGFSVRCVANE